MSRDHQLQVLSVYLYCIESNNFFFSLWILFQMKLKIALISIRFYFLRILFTVDNIHNFISKRIFLLNFHMWVIYSNDKQRKFCCWMQLVTTFSSIKFNVESHVTTKKNLFLWKVNDSHFDSNGISFFERN